MPASPPPAYGPGPVRPSPLGAFLGRVLRGDWSSAAKVALWPTGLLTVLAVALAVPSYGQGDEVVVGWGDRFRIMLALLLQGVGGGFELKAGEPSPYGPGGYGSDAGVGGWTGYVSGPDGLAQGTVSLSVVPLTVTALLIAALWLGARRLRRRGGEPEAAVRVSVLVAGVVLVLGLFAQPEIEGVEVSSSPLAAAFGALAISLVVTGGVLQRDRLTARLAAHPAAGSAVRALGTAIGVVSAVVALCSLVGFAVYAGTDEVDGTALLLTLPVLPNIGFAVLGMSWGGSLKYDFWGTSGVYGSEAESGAFGLGEISDEWGGGAVAGAVVLGVVCALAIGLWTAHRSADRREQVLGGAFTLGLVLVFTGVSGVAVDLAGYFRLFVGFGGMGRAEVAPSVPDTLLFGLLWVGGSLLLGPVLLRLVGKGAVTPGTGPVAPQVWPAPGYPPPGSGFAAGAAASMPAPEAHATPNAAGLAQREPAAADPGAGGVPEPGQAGPSVTPTAVDGGAATYAPGPYAPQPPQPGGPS